MLLKTIFVTMSTLAACRQKQGVKEWSTADTLPQDQELSVDLAPPLTAENCVGGWNVINPAFSFMPNSDNVAVAMRGLCLRAAEHGHAGWFSKVVIGGTSRDALRSAERRQMAFRSLKITADPRLVGEEPGKVDCRIPQLDYAEGSEDPRLIATPDGLFLIVAGYVRVPQQENGTHPECGDVGFHLYSSKVLDLDPPRLGNPVPLRFESMGLVEKNWAMFVTGREVDHKVHAVYSVFPHTIATVNLHLGQVEFKHKTYAASVSKLARSIGVEPSQFHGGSGVAHVKTAEHEYYLSIMHVGVEKEGRTEYWNFPYKFQPRKPFAIMHIGRRIDLQLLGNPVYGGEMVAFVTTVMYDQGDVFIGYGSGDRSSRTLRMPLSEFHSKHFSGTELMGTDQVLEPVQPIELPNAHACTNAVYSEVCQDALATSFCRECRADG